MTDYSVLSDFEISCEVLAVFEPDINHMVLSDDKSCFYDCGPAGDGWNQIDIPDFCGDPANSLPIIIDNKISLLNHRDDEGENIESTTWSATTNIDMTWFGGKDEGFQHSDKNPLRAAMIVFLMMQDNK